MPTCLFCNKHFKTKKSFKTHEESKNHKQNLSVDLKDLFIKSLVSLIYKYDEFRELETVYKEFIQKFNLSFKMAGFKNLNEIDFEGKVVFKIVEGTKYVKGHANYIEEYPLITLNFNFNLFN